MDDLTKELEKDLVGADGQQNENIEAGTEGGGGTTEEQAFKPEEKFPILGQLDTLGVNLPEDFEITEETTEDQLKDVINKQLESKFKPEDDNDPLLQEYKAAKEAGMTPEEFIERKKQALEFVNLNPDDGMKRYFQSIPDEKGERKYTDEQINEYLGKLTAIEKDQMWSGIREKIAGGQQQQTTQQKPDYKSYVDQVNQQIEQDYKDLFDKKAKQEELFGLPYGETEKADFNKKFLDLIKVDPEREPVQIFPRKAIDILNDPEKLYNLLYLNDMIESGKFEKMMKDMKDNLSEEFLKKGGLAPRVPSGSSSKHIIKPPESTDFV